MELPLKNNMKAQHYLLIGTLIVGTFCIGLLIGSASDVIAILAVLVSFASSIIGWSITLRKMNFEKEEQEKEHVEERRRLAANHYMQYNLDQIRKLDYRLNSPCHKL